MIENIRSESEKKSLSDGIKILKSAIPATESVLNAFIPVAEAKIGEIERLKDWKGFRMTAPDSLLFEQGRPLLSGMEFPEFGDEFSKTASNMAKALKVGLPDIETDFDKVIEEIDSKDFSKRLALAIWEGDTEMLSELCNEKSVPLKAALLTGTSSMDVFLNIIHEAAAPLIKDFRWSKGFCPICGSFPDMAVFRKSGTDDPYLKSHGGQRWLHCSTCGHEWRFKRATCPYCETDKHEELKYFQSEDRPDERIDVCDKCKHYLISIDSREYIKQPDLRIAAKAYIHMDIIAQEKGYTPLAETGWNSI